MILDINVLTYNPLRVAEVWMDDYRYLQYCISFCFTQLEYFLLWIPHLPQPQPPDSCTTTGTGVGTSRSPAESGTLGTSRRGEHLGRGSSATLSNGAALN